MANTPVQGKLILLELSPDDGATWYTLQCLIKQGLNGTRTTNTKATQCGTSIGLGPTDIKVPFEFDYNSTPDAAVAGIGTASCVQMMQWFIDGQLLLFRQMYPADGSVFYRSGSTYITDYNEEEPVDNVITASGNLSVTGTLVLEAPEP